MRLLGSGAVRVRRVRGHGRGVLYIVYLQPGGHQHRQVSELVASSPSLLITSCSKLPYISLTTGGHILTVPHPLSCVPNPHTHTRTHALTHLAVLEFTPIHAPERMNVQLERIGAHRFLNTKLPFLHPPKEYLVKQFRFNGTSVLCVDSLS